MLPVGACSISCFFIFVGEGGDSGFGDGASDFGQQRSAAAASFMNPFATFQQNADGEICFCLASIGGLHLLSAITLMCDEPLYRFPIAIPHAFMDGTVCSLSNGGAKLGPDLLTKSEVCWEVLIYAT